MIDELKATLAEMNPEALLLPGHDGALLGIMIRAGKDPIAVYSVSGVLQEIVAQLPEEMQKTETAWTDALEHFHYNVAGAWVGQGTPGFVYTFTDADMTLIDGPEIEQKEPENES